MGRAFERFWRDDDGLRTSMLACMRRVMKVMADVPAVLGYDAFNEPMGSVGALLGGALERQSLPDFYEACVRLRDELDPTRLLFVEPSPFAAFGAPVRLPRMTARDLVYAPHLYDAAAIVAGRYVPALSLFPRSLRRIEQTARRLDMPLLVGELGVLNGVRGGARMMEDECRSLDRALRELDRVALQPDGARLERRGRVDRRAGRRRPPLDRRARAPLSAGAGGRAHELGERRRRPLEAHVPRHR